MPASCQPNSHSIEIHGHRGCRGLFPENTIPGFLHALALGVDVLELDVVISADRQVVVSHEPWLNPVFCLDAAGNRIPPRRGFEHNLYRMAYADIRRCDCGSMGHPHFPAQVLMASHKPLLREVFAASEAAVATHSRPLVRYSVELKSSPEGDDTYHPGPVDFVGLVMAELVAADVLARTTVLSFDVRVLQVLRRQHPGVATCLLLEGPMAWLDAVRALGFVPTTFGPDYTGATPEAVAALRREHPMLRLVPWTVNSPVDMRRLIALGVDGLTTDYPNHLLELLSAL